LCVTSFHGPYFERAEQGSADAAKPRIRRNIVKGDLARVGDRAHGKDAAIFDGDEEGVIRLPDPRYEDLRRLIA
jgi:hypothetical protein